MNEPHNANLRDPDPAFLSSLGEFLGPAGALAAADAEGYLTEMRGKMRGLAALVTRPANVEQTAEILRRCSAAGVAVVPYAGGTGLVGGQVKPDRPAPIVLSIERMRRIRSVDADENVMIVEAGCVLADLQAAAASVDRLFPLNLASEGSCRIGGNLATNAGGVSAIRYGVARDLCLGIEAALPNGDVLRGLSSLRKDNAGFDLKNLLIGSEGALGVITAASLKLYPRPQSQETLIVGLSTPEAALDLLRRLQDQLGDMITAFELMSDIGIGFLLDHAPNIGAPISPRPPWTALIEASGPPMRESLFAALADAVERELALGAVVAENTRQREELWRIREEIPTANRAVGAVASHDIAAPLAKIGAVIRQAEQAVLAIAPTLRINCFGHLGDGNLHYNVFPPPGADKRDYMSSAPAVSRAIHDVVASHGGSISAEHGVGRFKISDLARYGDPTKLSAMRAIKKALDPRGIMNPGAVLGDFARTYER